MSQPNWLGLLQWSLAYSDGTKESEGKTLSEEDKLWLEQVMKEGVRDEPTRMNEIILAITNALERGVCEADEDQFENDLEEIKCIVDQIDMAQVFAKFGGAKCLIRIIESNISDEVKALAASVIGTMAQNNLKVQDILFNDGVIVTLMTIYAKTDSGLLCAKLLYAVSCIVRSHAAAELFFVNHLAQSVIGHALKSRHEPLVLRAVFLSNALIASDSATYDRIKRLASVVLPAVFAHFNTSNMDLQENVAALLTTLLHTEHGYNMLTTTLAADVQAMLAARREYIAKSSSSGSGSEEEEAELSAEEAAHCTHIVHRIVGLITLPVTVRHPHPHVIAALSGGSGAAAGAAPPSGDIVLCQDDLGKWQVK